MSTYSFASNVNDIFYLEVTIKSYTNYVTDAKGAYPSISHTDIKRISKDFDMNVSKKFKDLVHPSLLFSLVSFIFLFVVDSDSTLELSNNFLICHLT